MYCTKFKKEITRNDCEICPPEDSNFLNCEYLKEVDAAVSEQGKKFDNDKIQYDLIPPECIEELAKVLTYGAKKYAPNNWKKVEPFNDRYYSALMRHLEAWRKGEEKDTESGLRHLSHVVTNAVFLLWKDLQCVSTAEEKQPYCTERSKRINSTECVKCRKKHVIESHSDCVKMIRTEKSTI